MGGSGVGVHGCPGVCRVAIFEQIWIFSRKLFYPQGRIVGAGGGPEAGGSPLPINSGLSSVEPTNGKIRPPRFPGEIIRKQGNSLKQRCLELHCFSEIYLWKCHRRKSRENSK